MPTKSQPLKSPLIPFDYEPMEMKPVAEIPVGDVWLYEPKWDGFRCIAFCTGGDVELRSKKGESLSRYFPEIIAALASLPSKDFVLDGELMVWHGTTPVFDQLLARIHPAESRVKKLSVETPAVFMVFDLLMAADSKKKPVLFADQKLSKRRERLEKFAVANFKKSDSLILSPASSDIEQAKDWFAGKGVELDGIIAKKLDLAYQTGNRNGAVKVKRANTADCVVGGFRYNEGTKHVGSLLLGLYDDDGELHHVGFTSAFSAAEKLVLTKKLEPLIAKTSFTVNIPGGPSRWNRGKESPWVPLKIKLVVEVKFDHFTGGRFRHGTKILRWRDDKKPGQCKFDQL
jgi:ATP-dependent DNA ligase